jgi:dTDP-4-dehydrorhamnose reductase
MNSWLVTGVSGLLGSNAALDLSGGHRVVGTARRPPAAPPVEVIAIDLADPASRNGLVRRAGADAVFHAAAVSTIEDAERDPGQALDVNVVASADLAAQAAESGAAFVYISTDAVFDGARGGYREDDAPDPQSVYGRTKLDGERAVLDAHPGALVARVNFYGWSPSGRRSLAEFFYGALSRGESVNGFEDQVVSTLYAGSLIESVVALLEAGASGIVHVASPEPTTKYAFGRRIAESFGYDPELVRAARSTDHLDLPRGTRLDLDTAKMESLLGHPADGQQAGIDRLVRDREAGRPAALAAFRA